MASITLEGAEAIARRFKRSIGAGLLASAAALALAAGSVAHAQEPGGEAGGPATIDAPIEVQLNKLEDVDGGCRAYVVVNNQNALAIQSLMLEMISFRTDGVIGQRFSVELGPLSGKKRSVKLFRLDANCDDIGSFLVNQVLKCESANGPIEDCMSGLTVSALTKAEFMK